MKEKIRTITEKECPLEIAVNTITGKWKIPIIWHMNAGKKRPCEFLREIENVDRRVLNQQLKEMETDGLIAKKSYNQLPLKVEYTLTELGQKLVEVLWQLNEWGKLLQ